MPPLKQKRNLMRFSAEQHSLASVARFRNCRILTRLNIFTREHNLVIDPIFGFLSSRAIQNIPNMLGYL